MAVSNFEAAYDELDSLRESYYIDNDDKAVQAVAEAVMADDELKRWWKFAEERCLNNRGRFKTALEEQIYTSLHVFPC